MLGLKKICVIVLLSLLPFGVMAQEQEVVVLEDIQLVSDTSLTKEGKIDAVETEAVVTVEPLPPDPAETEVGLLLAKAKQENSARASMRRASLTEAECLATALYHEARGEGVTGMKAVAFVIYNRVKSQLFPTSYCKVILQKSQFSFTSDRNPDNIKEWDTYAKVLAMAVDLVQNNGFQRIVSPVGNALFFNSFRSRNGWSHAKARKFVATIGNHHFFK